MKQVNNNIRDIIIQMSDSIIDNVQKQHNKLDYYGVPFVVNNNTWWFIKQAIYLSELRKIKNEASK